MSSRAAVVGVLIGFAAQRVVVAQSNAVSLSQTAELARVGSVINLPGLTVHGGDHRYIEAKGQFALTDGILEFIAVEPHGRDYESLLALDCKPSELQFALILIGCESGTVPQRAKVGEKIGDRLQLEAEWEDGAKTNRVVLEKLLLDRHTKKTPADVHWIYTGSYFVKDFDGREVFMADAEQAFVALWWSSSVLINVGGEYGNPYRGDSQGFEVNKAVAPPKGTPVKLLLRRIP
jgi:hypothetical protein